VGVDPADDVPIIANNGRDGPYRQKGKDFRNIASEEQLLEITLPQTLEDFAMPKTFKRGGHATAAKAPLRQFGTRARSRRADGAEEGRVGVYVTDGETNASLNKGDRLEAMPQERAYELLAIRREAILEKGGPTKRAAANKKAPAKRAAGAKKAPARKAAA